MNKKIKIGIIGAGAIGSVHANAYAKLEDAEVVALCDILPDKLAEKAARHHIGRTYGDYKELLANPEIDAVSVCVPNHVHASIAIDAMRAGKHVMLEKPMSINAALAQEVVDVRNETGRVLQMGMVRRQNAKVDMIKKLIDEGRLGEIYQMRIKFIRRRGIPGLGGWFTTKALAGGGGIIDCAVHALDLSCFLSGYWNPTAVSAQTYAKFGSPIADYHYVSMWAGPPKMDGVFDVDDYAAGLIRFGARATLSFEVSWACNAREEAVVELLGDKGGVRIADNEQETVLLTEFDNQIADIRLDYAKNDMDGFPRELQLFLGAVRGENPVPATGEQGVILMKILDGIYESSEKNREVLLSC